MTSSPRASGGSATKARTNPILETCPLNTRKPVGNPRWGTYLAMPSTIEPELTPGARIVATFISETDPATQPSIRVDVVEYPGFSDADGDADG